MRYVKKGEFERALETVMLYKHQQKAEVERIEFILSGQYFSEDTLVKNVGFNNITYRKLRENLPTLFNKPWDTITMHDFRNTTYIEMFELLKKSIPSMKNIENICFSYGISLK